MYIVDFMKKEEIPALVDLELDLYPAECVFPVEGWSELYDKNNYINLVARDENQKVVGVLNIMPMTQKLFDKVLNGTYEFLEDLSYDSILPFEDNMTADFHFGTFVTKEKEVAVSLMFGLIKYARLLRKKNIKMNRLSCIIASPEGQHLCESLGFDIIHEFESYGNGFAGGILVLDMNKKSKSFLINKIQRILFSKDNEKIK